MTHKAKKKLCIDSKNSKTIVRLMCHFFYKILLMVPVPLTSVERSFLKLKILKSYLRSMMTQERLNGLTILSIGSHFLQNLDHHKIRDVFCLKNARIHRLDEFSYVLFV